MTTDSTPERSVRALGSVALITAGPAVALAVALAVVLAAGLATGCASATVGFESPSPLHRAKAIALASTSDDPADLPALVRALSSEDPAERLFAARALEQRTGTTRGFDHASSPEDRASAVAGWRLWLETGRDAEPEARAQETREAVGP